jgi:hypothetical protein
MNNTEQKMAFVRQLLVVKEKHEISPILSPTISTVLQSVESVPEIKH